MSEVMCDAIDARLSRHFTSGFIHNDIHDEHTLEVTTLTNELDLANASPGPRLLMMIANTG